MKKFASIDYLRAFSMLFIAGYWHIFDYSAASFGHDNPVMIHIAHIVLAIFLFTSGLLLGGENTRRMSAKRFYIRRLLRIYPLYVLAVLVFYLYGINDGWTSVTAILGISMYSGSTPLTLWFTTMIVLFYMVTPLLLLLVDNILVYAAAVGGLLAVTIGLMLTFNTVDPRLILYFPSFCLGIFCASHGLRSRLVNPITASIFLAIAFGLAFVTFSIETLNYLAEAPLLAFSVYLILYACIDHDQHFKPNRMISLLSYSSFAIYLFHRPVYTTLQELYFPSSPLFQMVYLFTIGLSMAVLAGWTSQKSYDLLYANLQLRLRSTQNVVT